MLHNFAKGRISCHLLDLLLTDTRKRKACEQRADDYPFLIVDGSCANFLLLIHVSLRDQ